MPNLMLREFCEAGALC